MYIVAAVVIQTLVKNDFPKYKKSIKVCDLSISQVSVERKSRFKITSSEFTSDRIDD